MFNLKLYNMKQLNLYLFNGQEIPERLYYELKDYSVDNEIPFRINIVSEKMAVTNVYRVTRNFQIEVRDFIKFFVDLFSRKNLYFKKCCDNEII